MSTSEESGARKLEGQRVPSVSWPVRSAGEWQTVHSDDIFAGRRVVVFALPGAFTPTCSNNHLPRYDELADLFHAAGIDDIVCISVNDPHVMAAWADEQGIQQVRMIPDGNAEFTARLGMLTDRHNLGMGQRSWRYSMLVSDGVIEKMFAEAEKPGDPFEVSDAETMLRFISPQTVIPPAIALFTRPGCPWCARARRLLQQADLAYSEIDTGRDVSNSALRAICGADRVPQIYIDGRLIGGSDELAQYLGIDDSDFD
ncbi:MAG: glutathione peroxidase [Pseudomonadota bacterium]|nr:glutathione peroxidase [Pseudomonadota bacterium]